MKVFFKQFSSLIGAGVAAACCLGIPAILAAMGAAGLGFIVQDAYLFPIFVGFAGYSLRTLYRSARSHGNLAPFWLGLAGGLLGGVALWLMVTGVYPAQWAVYAGMGALVLGSLWDGLPGPKPVACACESETARPSSADTGRRLATGAALSVAAAGVFYGMYRSVAAFAPEAEEGEIACWGINECKGTTACTTAFNACTGQNECRGRGYLYVPPKQCALRGGVPLKGSEADPAKALG